jgi:hypothetical protein
MRQVCNVTYAYITEGMTTKEREKFDRELDADDATTVSHGTKELFALMGGPRRPPTEQEG